MFRGIKQHGEAGSTLRHLYPSSTELLLVPSEMVINAHLHTLANVNQCLLENKRQWGQGRVTIEGLVEREVLPHGDADRRPRTGICIFLDFGRSVFLTNGNSTRIK